MNDRLEQCYVTMIHLKLFILYIMNVWRVHCLGRNDLVRFVRSSVRFDLCKLGARRASAGVNSGRERVTGTRGLQWGI